MRPPRSGPMMGEITNMVCTIERACSRRSSWKQSLARAVHMVSMEPAPRAWITRATTSVPTVGETEQRKQPAMKRAEPLTSTGLRPYLSLMGPKTRKPTA